MKRRCRMKPHRVLVALVNALAWLGDRAVCAFPNLTDSEEE